MSKSSTVGASEVSVEVTVKQAMYPGRLQVEFAVDGRTRYEWHDVYSVPAQVTRVRIEVAHNLTDDKGRAVGGFALVVGVPGRDTWEVELHATRNGKPYGATPRGTTVQGIAKARELAFKKLGEQRARYAKQYGAK